MPIPAGSFRPSNPKVGPLLLQLAAIFLLPLALGPTLLPLGVELLLADLGWVQGVPVCLALSLVELAAVGFVYRLVLAWEGRLLHAREQKLIEVVTARAQ
jgi:hypothetical protein